TQDRARLAQHDPHFRAMYEMEQPIVATAQGLGQSMRGAAVEVSVVCGFWWEDPALAEQQPRDLGDTAAPPRGSRVRLPPPPPRCLGVGEVRLDHSEDFPEADRPWLVHCSEDVGHNYPGKLGGLTPGGLWRLMEAHPDARVIAAHWGAGFPFFALMPEVARL